MRKSEAIRQAGARAKGATLYVTLEPRLHIMARRLPCADAIVAAGIARVVSRSEDPNPEVAGTGRHTLAARAAGTDTTVGGAWRSGSGARQCRLYPARYQETARTSFSSLRSALTAWRVSPAASQSRSREKPRGSAFT